jgi:alkylation response protein AidB-like acyl-CoA dehydrogenase
LLLAPKDAAGVTVSTIDLLDVRDWANVTFDAVQLPKDALLAEGEAADRLIERALDLGRALAAAEMLGMAQEAFDRTIAYLKEREQFGVKIGTFQALQHRGSRLYIALEIMRSTVFKALRALDEDPVNASNLASLAKIYATRTARLMQDEAIQLHGGIGATDALDIGLFYKRTRVLGDWLGDDSFHKERLAARKFAL